jgi:hypothetical protein
MSTRSKKSGEKNKTVYMYVMDCNIQLTQIMQILKNNLFNSINYLLNYAYGFE